MWLERFTIVVPTLVNPRLPYARAVYQPTWVELSLSAGCFAGFILLYVLFSKLFPIVSIWEVREGRQKGLEEAVERIKSYLPGAEGAAT
jgi:molybdopterin-containing oxidoreductase family membrane subunit